MVDSNEILKLLVQSLFESRMNELQKMDADELVRLNFEERILADDSR